VNLAYIAMVSLVAACDGGAVTVHREIDLFEEIDYDAWNTRRQFPYELEYAAVTATYSTVEPQEFIRFHCGPIGHMVRHVALDGKQVEELAQIRLETQTGKKLCKKITARLHRLAEENGREGPIAKLQLEDRHASGKPHVASIRYKARVIYFDPQFAVE
jgi:hypothetical protein